MAESNFSNITCETWTNGQIFRGTKLDLIGAGVVPDVPFPGDPECCRKLTVDLCLRDGREVRVTRLGRRGRFSVFVWFPLEEQIVRKEQKDFEGALARENKLMAELPSSAAKYLEEVRLRMVSVLWAARSTLLTEDLGGYRITPESLREFDCVASDLLGVIEDASVTFSQKRRDDAVRRIKSKTARADPAVQRFMREVVGDAA